MKKYFDSILSSIDSNTPSSPFEEPTTTTNNNPLLTEKMSGSSANDKSCKIIYSYNGFGSEELNKLLNSKGIQCINLLSKVELISNKIYNELPNEYITPEELKDAITDSCLSSLENLIDNDTYILATLSASGYNSLLNNIVSMSTINKLIESVKKYTMFYLNFDVNSMFYTLEQSKTNLTTTNAREILTSMPTFYEKTEKTEQSFEISKKYISMNLKKRFKKCFESEDDLNKFVDDLFIQFQSTDDAIHIKPKLPKTHDKTISIDITPENVDDQRTVFSKVII